MDGLNPVADQLTPSEGMAKQSLHGCPYIVLNEHLGNYRSEISAAVILNHGNSGFWPAGRR